MVASPLRDDATLQRGLGAWLGSDDLTFQRPTRGFSNETILVTARRADGTRELVVRLPPVVATFPDPPSRWLGAQAALHAALHHAGVSVPHPVTVVADESYVGAPFLVMPRCPGRAAGDAPGLDPWITDSTVDEQRALHERWADLLGQLHAAPFDADRLAAAGLRVGLATEVQYWRDYADWAADGAPATVLCDALDWCRATAPATTAPDSALWGDARLGNVLFADDRTISSALDWELGTIGPAEMDLSWYLVLDELTTKVTKAPVPGFLSRDELLARWARRSGRDPLDLPWHDCFALARSIAINDRQARIAAQLGLDYPGVAGDDNPMLRVLARRIERYGT
jgi:aminoglycoside phosphotransferase (APT) family kinase protein